MKRALLPPPDGFNVLRGELQRGGLGLNGFHEEMLPNPWILLKFGQVSFGLRKISEVDTSLPE